MLPRIPDKALYLFLSVLPEFDEWRYLQRKYKRYISLYNNEILLKFLNECKKKMKWMLKVRIRHFYKGIST